MVPYNIGYKELKMERRLLIDGNHLAGRSWAVMQELMTSSGNHSGAVFGVLKGLSYARKEFGVDFKNMIVCWDTGRCARRMEILPDYKAGRRPENPTPEEEESRLAYITQLKALRYGVAVLGCRQSWEAGVEADDLIGILSRTFMGFGCQAIIYSGDKDFHQLVTPLCLIHDPKKGILTESIILEHWGVDSLEKIIWYKSMVGDSDNIDGIYGIGDVRAQNILRHLDLNDPWKLPPDVPEKQIKHYQKFLDNRTIVERNIELIRIPTTAPEAIQRSLYTSDQMINALERAQTCHRDDVELLKFLKMWELESQLNLTGVF